MLFSFDNLQCKEHRGESRKPASLCFLVDGWRALSGQCLGQRRHPLGVFPDRFFWLLGRSKARVGTYHAAFSRVVARTTLSNGDARVGSSFACFCQCHVYRRGGETLGLGPCFFLSTASSSLAKSIMCSQDERCFNPHAAR